jgi:hypothetical protein
MIARLHGMLAVWWLRYRFSRAWSLYCRASDWFLAMQGRTAQWLARLRPRMYDRAQMWGELHALTGQETGWPLSYMGDYSVGEESVE